MFYSFLPQQKIQNVFFSNIKLSLKRKHVLVNLNVYLGLQRGITSCINIQLCGRILSKKIWLLTSKIPLDKYLRVCYYLMSGASYFQSNTWEGVSDTTIISIKRKLRLCYQHYIDNNPILLGGIGAIVEADESVICKR